MQHPVHVVVVVPARLVEVQPEHLGMAVGKSAYDLPCIRRSDWRGGRMDATVKGQLLLVEGSCLKHHNDTGGLSDLCIRGTGLHVRSAVRCTVENVPEMVRSRMAPP